MAGRTTLVSSVTTAIPSYVMQTSLLPASSWETLDKLNRGFLWGNTEEKRKISLVAWDEVCKPKKKGGLGIRHAKLQNHSLLMKLGWQLVTRRDDFWVQVVRDKYKCGTDLIPKIELNRPGSNVWSGIKKTWKSCKEGVEVTATGGVRWKGNTCGVFSAKSAYTMICKEGDQGDPLWGRIWKLKVPERCRNFIWLVAHRKLLTNASRRKRGLSDDETCPVCNKKTEDLIHVLRDCAQTKELWKELVHPMAWRRFTSLEFTSWLRWNIMADDSRESVKWRSTFAVTCWWVWKRRNAFVFEQKIMSTSMILASIRAMVDSNWDAHEKFLKGRLQGSPPYVLTERWKPPEIGWVKVNVDGAFSHITNSNACGGLVRNENGEFLRGFLFRIDDGVALTAELWACVQGLRTTWELGCRNVILESDSSEAVSLLNEGCYETHAEFRLVEEARNMMTRDWDVHVIHVSRWMNTAADWLAKQSLSVMPGFHAIMQAPTELDQLLQTEKG